MKSKLVLGLAVVTIGVGLYGVSGALLPQAAAVASEQENNPPPVNTYRVWRLKSSLPKGSLIQRSDLEVVRMSEEQALALSVVEPQKINFKKPLYLNRDIQKSEVVYSEDLLSPGDRGYINMVLAPNHVPFNLEIDAKSIVGGSIAIGDIVDISTISSPKQNLSEDDLIDDVRRVEMAPLITQVKVLDIVKPKHDRSNNNDGARIILIVEVNNRELAKLTLAKRIADLEVHKSIGEEFANQLHASSGDVIHTSSVNAVREFRSNKG